MDLRQTSQHEALDECKRGLRRKEHAERLKRIMDEKYLKMGMDYETLERQIEEKKERERLEDEEEKAYQINFLKQQRLLSKLAAEEKKEIRAINQEDNEFRANHQKMEDRREWDLNAPGYNPCFKGELVFKGEDSDIKEREQRQREQLLRWQKEQMAENRNKKALEHQENLAWQKKYLDLDNLSVSVGNAEKQARMDWRRECEEYNKKLAAEKKAREAAEREEEIIENNLEMAKTRAMLDASDNRLPERNDCHMVVQDFKGFTKGMTQQYRDDREAQIAENARVRAENALKEKREDAERQRNARMAIKQERRLARERKQKDYDIAMENLKTTKSRSEENKEQAYEDFLYRDKWWPFGKSHR